jgi:hypothetical protein
MCEKADKHQIERIFQRIYCFWNPKRISFVGTIIASIEDKKRSCFHFSPKNVKRSDRRQERTLCKWSNQVYFLSWDMGHVSEARPSIQIFFRIYEQSILGKLSSRSIKKYHKTQHSS